MAIGAKKCVVCGSEFTPKSWNNYRTPICSKECRTVRRVARAKTVTLTCLGCGKDVIATGTRALALANRGRAYCSDKCKAAVVRATNSRTMSRTNNRDSAILSARMTERNPMRSAETREKVSKTLSAMGHKPRTRGGNGTGPTEMEQRLRDALPQGWEIGAVVRTGRKRASGYPGHYKLDLAFAPLKLAVEVDGFSHTAMSRKAQDAKKQAFLESLGWCVLRFTNREVQTDLGRCVQEIASTTSRLKETATTSPTAS